MSNEEKQYFLGPDDHCLGAEEDSRQGCGGFYAMCQMEDFLGKKLKNHAPLDLVSDFQYKLCLK